MKKILAGDYSAGTRRLLIAGFFVLVMLAWHFGVAVFEVSPLIFPGPVAVMQALVAGLRSGEYWLHLGVTLHEIVAGFAIGAGTGFVLGVAIGQIRLLDQELETGALVCPFETIARRDVSYYLLSPKRDSVPKKVSIFREWLLAETQRSRDECII